MPAMTVLAFIYKKSKQATCVFLFASLAVYAADEVPQFDMQALEQEYRDMSFEDDVLSESIGFEPNAVEKKEAALESAASHSTTDTDFSKEEQEAMQGEDEALGQSPPEDMPIISTTYMTGVGITESDGEHILLSLPESIFITLRDNEALETAYLNRITQRFSLRNSEHNFNPQGSLSLGSTLTDRHNRNNSYSRTWSVTGPSLSLTQNLKTGGKFAFTWNNGQTISKTQSNVNVHGTDSTATSTLGFTYTQPLLKGGGIEIGTLSLQRAYLTEERNINSLKRTVINQINDVIKQYRAFILAIENFKIQERGIARSRNQFERNKLLVEAGRRPPSDLTQDKANLARREFTFEQQIDSRDDARITLLRTMNIDTGTPILPENRLELEVDYLPSVEECLDIAYVNDPDYLNELISLREAELTLISARNNFLWDLSFSAGANADATGGTSPSSMAQANEKAFTLKNKSWNTKLSLTIPLNDIGREQTLLGARVGMRNAKIALRKRQEDMSSTFKNLLRRIKSQIRQVDFAANNTKFQNQKLDEARIRFQSGEKTNFELISFEDDLTQAETDELSARITLLNSLTDLDSALGTTLDTWQIDINRRTANSPRFQNKFYKQKLYTLGQNT